HGEATTMIVRAGGFVHRSLAPFVAGALVLGGAMIAPRSAIGVQPVRDEISSPKTEIDAVGPFVAQRASKALQDTVWIADWSFDGAGGSCTDAGWIKYDNRILNTHVDAEFWHVDNRFDGLTDGAMIPTQLIFNNAAILAKHDLCWASDGYGNDLDFSIKLKAGAGAQLSFNRLSDSEPNADFVTVETDSASASEALANICVNPKRTAASFRAVLMTNSGPTAGAVSGLTMPAGFGPGTHQFYIRFNSDGGYSDEDGDYLTAHHAGLIVDNI